MSGREAESEGRERQTTGPTKRNHIEADMLGEKANTFKAQILSGKHRRRCGGYKWESKCAIPGEVCPVSKQHPADGGSGVRKLESFLIAVQKSAEAIVDPMRDGMKG